MTWPVRSALEASLYVPVAVNCWVEAGRDRRAGRGDRDALRVAALTVSTVEPLTSPRVALMLDVPAATPVREPAVLIVAAGSSEAQVTWPVRSALELSQYVPVAVNCWVRPAAIDGLAGVTAML